MLKPAFDIIPGDLDPHTLSSHHLVMEIGDRVFSYFIFDKSNHALVALRDFVFDSESNRPMADMIAEVVASDPVLARKFHDTTVVYSFPESSLLPSTFNNDSLDRSITQLVYGNVQKGMIFREPVEGWEMVNVYRISRDLQSFIEQEFHPSRIFHAYTLMLGNLEREAEDENLLKLRFYSDRLVVMAIKNGALQVIQTFFYQTPDDAAYHLLAICEQFDISPSSVLLEVGGLIDKQSALYSELQKYFLHIHHEEFPGMESGELLTDFPAHYFSPLLKFATCV